MNYNNPNPNQPRAPFPPQYGGAGSSAPPYQGGSGGAGYPPTSGGVYPNLSGVGGNSAYPSQPGYPAQPYPSQPASAYPPQSQQYPPYGGAAGGYAPPYQQQAGQQGYRPNYSAPYEINYYYLSLIYITDLNKILLVLVVHFQDNNFGVNLGLWVKIVVMLKFGFYKSFQNDSFSRGILFTPTFRLYLFKVIIRQPSIYNNLIQVD